MTYQVALNLLPMPRPRVNPRGGVGYPKRYRQHLETLRHALANYTLRNGSTIWLEVEVWKPLDPRSPRFGDADNLAKTVMDALPFDDRFVTKITLRKMRGARPLVVITLTEVIEP